MTNDNAALLSMLHMVCDKLRFEANSPGGLVASIEAVILDGSRQHQQSKLVYNKITKKIDLVRNYDGLRLDSFDPPPE